MEDINNEIKSKSIANVCLFMLSLISIIIKNLDYKYFIYAASSIP